MDKPAETERAVRQTDEAVNVATRLTAIAERMPDAVAVACPGRGDVAGQHAYATCTFAQLDQDATALARALVDLGVVLGTRLVLLVRPGIEFVKLVFALLRSGATTILIDPGMGKQHLIDCLASVDPQGFVAISPAQAARVVSQRRFHHARLNVTVGLRWFWGGHTYRQLLEQGRRSSAKLPFTRGGDPAAIIFTSGSTGPPKGVWYTHRMFDTQVAEIQREYDLQPGGADLACFALFGLFNSAMGITTVFPQMDFSRPGRADPRLLLRAANDWQVTQAFASPSVWDQLSRYCAAHGEQIPTLRKVFSCGAPVPAQVLRRTLACVQANAEMHTPYGATECLPVATMDADEVLGETARQTADGAGVCVGRKFETVDWRVVRITDEPIETLADAVELPPGEIGELMVAGPQVSPAYVVGEEHNAAAKIRDGTTVWHRMGDVGYLDPQGRFWYCGRKNHRVETRSRCLFSANCEEIINSHPAVARSALVGIGKRGDQTPVMVVELSPDTDPKTSWERIAQELRDLTRQHPGTEAITNFLQHKSLPVDVRHNAKINREALAKWAASQLTS